MLAACGTTNRLIKANVFEDYWFDSNRKIPDHTSAMMELARKLDESVQKEDSSTIKENHQILLKAIEDGHYDSLFQNEKEKPSILSKNAVKKPLGPSIELINSVPAMPLTYALPGYPPIAKLAHVQGEVEFSLEIDSVGKISKVTFDDGHPMLKKVVEDAVRTWQYPSGLKTAHAVIGFNLNCASSQ